MSDFINVHPVEFLAVARAYEEGRPSVVITIRPEPGSWRPHNLALTWPQAERLRDNLTALLKTPAAFLLLALAALASGCSARVEVVNEKSAAVQTESESVGAPPASARHRTTVEVDLLGQRQPKPVAPPVTGEQPLAAEAEVEPDVSGDVTLIVVKEVHKHRHYHLPVLIGRHRWMSQCDEEERIRRFHEMKKRQYGY